ncbi:MAG: GTP 3',8-cyclase MoaA [Pirellulaceae bacterium]
MRAASDQVVEYEPLFDSFGRKHTSLRIGVTDRCNIRCFYCMPLENVQFQPRSEILSFEEIERFARIMVGAGVNKFRITGGEPLVRSDLPLLIQQLAQIPNVVDLAMTTNGMLLAQHAADLKKAGLQRLNISLDTLNEATFQKISRRTGLHQILNGIAEAQRIGFRQIRLNAVAIAGITEEEIVPLGRFAKEQKLELRFIEYMPLDADGQWDDSQVLSGQQIRQTLEAEFGSLVPSPRTDASQPAVDYHFADGGVVGFINPVTQPFCQTCNRLRLTADGKVRNCLFSEIEWDVRSLLRNNASDEDIMELVRDCVWHKKPGHGIDSDEFRRPERAMYQIGG